MTIPQGMTWPSACQVPIHFQSISSGSFRLLHLRLLFVGRSLNMIRSANFALGTAVNRVAILAECAAAGQGREGFQNRNPVVAKIFHKITQRFGWIWNINQGSIISHEDSAPAVFEAERVAELLVCSGHTLLQNRLPDIVIDAEWVPVEALKVVKITAISC